MKLWSLLTGLTGNGPARFPAFVYPSLAAGLSTGVACSCCTPWPGLHGDWSRSTCRLALRSLSPPAHDDLPCITLLRTSSMLRTVLLSLNGPSACAFGSCCSLSPSKLRSELECQPLAHPDELRPACAPCARGWDCGLLAAAAGMEGRLSVGDGDRPELARQDLRCAGDARVGLICVASAHNHEQ